MDPRHSPAAEAFRSEVRAFLAEHLRSAWTGVGALDGDELERFVRTDDPSAPNSPNSSNSPDSLNSWLGARYNAQAGTIHAGTAHVQRNILGEQVLGPPKEPTVR